MSETITAGLVTLADKVRDGRANLSVRPDKQIAGRRLELEGGDRRIFLFSMAQKRRESHAKYSRVSVGSDVRIGKAKREVGKHGV
jgi:hypothetical protein